MDQRVGGQLARHQLYGLDEVRAQIEAARLAGAKGFMLWNAQGVYTDGALVAASASS